MEGETPACDVVRSWPCPRSSFFPHMRPVDALDRGSHSNGRSEQREFHPTRYDEAPYSATTPVDLAAIPETYGFIAADRARRRPRRIGHLTRAEFPGSTGELRPHCWSAHPSPTGAYHTSPPSRPKQNFSQGVFNSRSDFSCFNGESCNEDYLDWEREVDEFFYCAYIPQERQVKHVIRKLIHARRLEGRSEVRTWHKMKRLLRGQFLTSDYEILSNETLKKSSGITEIAEKYNDNSEAKVKPISIEIRDDPEAKLDLAHIQFDEKIESLEGEVEAKNFSRFPSESYFFNPLLCGSWPESSCSNFVPKTWVQPGTGRSPTENFLLHHVGADLIDPHSSSAMRQSVTSNVVAFDESWGPSSWVDYNLQYSYPMRLQSQSSTTYYSSALNPNKVMNEMASPNALALNQNTQNLLDSQDSSVRAPMNTEAYGCEDSFIIQGNDISYAGSNAFGITRERCLSQINAHMDVMFHFKRVVSFPEVKRSIYHPAKEQNGCLLLHQKIDEGDAYVIAAIFIGIIGHVAGLMENPFGNYLIQKIIGTCNDQQRIRIVQMVTEDPYVFLRAALSTHGTRAVQKLIATIKIRYEADLIIKALIPVFVRLIKDANGSHAIQSCLTSLTLEYNKFIFDAAARNCVDIAMHRYGCRVLHICIAHSSGDQQTQLLSEISANGLDLAKDAFGNYTVQFILDLHNPRANSNLICQFSRNYVDLFKQKFCSNVVENCIEVFGEEDRAKLILELLHALEFKQLFQDPYANYVIQSALTVTKDTNLHSSVVQAIRSLAEELKSCPYFKKIENFIESQAEDMEAFDPIQTGELREYAAENVLKLSPDEPGVIICSGKFQSLFIVAAHKFGWQLSFPPKPVWCAFFHTPDSELESSSFEAEGI